MPRHLRRSVGPVRATARAKDTTQGLPAFWRWSALLPGPLSGQSGNEDGACNTFAQFLSIEYAEDPDITKEVFAFAMMPNRLRLRLSAIG